MHRRADFINALGLTVLLVPLTFAAGCGEASPVPDETPALAFTDVTAEAGLGDFRHYHGGFGQAWAPEIVGAGAAFLDYDGDDWPDVLLVAGGAFRGREAPDVPALRLFRNERDGTFSEQTGAAGLAGLRTYGLGLAAADYDNDGDTDVFLSTLYENLLLRNDGGRFTDVSAEAGLGEAAEWSTSALFFDADRDGDADLFVGTYVDWTPEKDVFCGFEGEKVYCTPEEYRGLPSRFYRNNGDGTFTERTREAGFLGALDPALDKTLGVTELDFDADGWPDLYVGNDTERDLLFRNDGDGTFTERGVVSGVAFDEHGKPRAGMGVDAGVVDSSGQVTLFVGNFSEEMAGVYRHTGDGFFLERAAASRLGHPTLRTLTFGLLLFDADLDGDLDLLAANGHVQTHIERMREGIAFRQPAQLFLNHGDGTFAPFTPAEGPLTRPLVGRGAAYADYDRDGDLDVLVTENDGPAHLWRNDLPAGHFLHVTAEGRASNRDGLGTRVVLAAGGHRQERRIRTGASYLSQSEGGAFFGLGASTRVDTLWLFWPSGVVETFTDLPADQRVHVVEGEGPRSEALPPR